MTGTEPNLDSRKFREIPGAESPGNGNRPLPQWWRHVWRPAVAGILAVLLFSGSVHCTARSEEPAFRRMKVQVKETYPHSRKAFTQGLLWYQGKLYESTGLRRYSSLRRVDPTTGRVEKIHELEPRYFAEGLARIDKRLYQLTYLAGKAFVYDIDTFEKLKTFDYKGQGTGQGWGLCYDGEQLIMSDGSHILYFRDPKTFKVTRKVSVVHLGKPIKFLNELEYVDGKIYANIWQEDAIAVIDPATGVVRAFIDVPGLRPSHSRPSQVVLNGIAYDPKTKYFYITGKRWPSMHKVRFE